MTQPVPNGLFGHPRGLMTLFFVEMWERFSYYGMRAIVVLYMAAPVEKGGLGFSEGNASNTFGWYAFTVYLLALPGGWIADRWMGYRKAIFLGGVILALGHFSLAFSGLHFFYSGLALIAIGTGLLKTTWTPLVGLLYDKDDIARRDSGYTIYYIGINIGAALAPLVVGFLAQDEGFRAYLASKGIDPNSAWHFAFAAAGVSMLLGLSQYLIQQKTLGDVGIKPGAVERRDNARHQEPLTREDWHRIAVICVLVVFATIFWATFEQAATTLTFFADRATDTTVLGYKFPSSWYQSVNSIFVITLGAVMSWLWVRLGSRAPSSPVRFAIGLFFVGLGMAILIPPSQSYDANGQLAGPMWLIGTYFIHTVGELCLSPIGQSLTSRIAPARVQGLMMGVWFLSLAFGNKIAGAVGGLFVSMKLTTLFGTIFAITTLAAVIVLIMKPLLNRWAAEKPEPHGAH